MRRRRHVDVPRPPLRSRRSVDGPCIQPSNYSVIGLDGETTRFVPPRVRQSETVHIILQLEDRGAPTLFAYRRAVITIEP